MKSPLALFSQHVLRQCQPNSARVKNGAGSLSELNREPNSSHLLKPISSGSGSISSLPATASENSLLVAQNSSKENQPFQATLQKKMGNNDRSSDIIELDEDIDASLKLALRLQAEFDAEVSYAARKPGTAHKQSLHEVFKSDEDYARALAVEFEEEFQNAQAGLSPLASKSQNQDEELARQLQADFDAQNHRAGYTEGKSTLPGDRNSLPVPGSLQSYFQYIKDTKCTSCRRRIISKPEDLLSLLQGWLKGDRTTADSAIKCPRCSASTCIGCAKRVNNHQKTFANTERINFAWCCSNGRLFLIFMMLCAYEFEEGRSVRGNDHQRDRSFSSFVDGTKERLRKHRSVPVQKSKSSGIGYGNDCMPAALSMLQLEEGLVNEPAGSKSKDTISAISMNSIGKLLPSLGRNSAFDYNPPPVLEAMISSSWLLEMAAEYLRNDSIDDVVKRKDVYYSVFRLVRALAGHESTAKFVHEERNIIPRDVTLIELCFAKKATDVFHARKKAKIEKGQSLTVILQNLKKQGTMILQHAELNQNEFNSKGCQDMLNMSLEISQLADFLKANLQAGDNSKKAPIVQIGMQEWHRENSVLDVSDELIFENHSFRSAANNKREVRPGRMRDLIVEITTLKTSLPPGIFVRHGTSRLDMMKVLIIGPEDTPYENGLFEFDLYCPHDYPRGPPQMLFRTTGGGRVRFNPNLYHDGKVCLSLLGTWSGEPWRPGQSTLLQVLVSIQSMIFCDEPWCNEPGREGQGGSRRSKNYNRVIQENTVRYAIFEWLETSLDHFWADVIRQHFEINGNAIQKTSRKWASMVHPPITALDGYEENTLGMRGINLSKLVPQLESAMRDYLRKA